MATYSGRLHPRPSHNETSRQRPVVSNRPPSPMCHTSSLAASKYHRRLNASKVHPNSLKPRRTLTSGEGECGQQIPKWWST